MTSCEHDRIRKWSTSSNKACLWECRLFSSAVFNDSFPEHAPPEIATTALEGVVLAMKALAIDRIPNFPFPSPPPPDALRVGPSLHWPVSVSHDTYAALSGTVSVEYGLSAVHCKTLSEGLNGSESSKDACLGLLQNCACCYRQKGTHGNCNCLWHIQHTLKPHQLSHLILFISCLLHELTQCLSLEAQDGWLYEMSL